MGSVDHVGLEKLKVGHVGISALEFAHILDILQFTEDEWCFAITLGMDESQDGVALFPSVFPSKPSIRNY